MAPANTRTSKDLLQLEGSNDSHAPGAKWKSICKVREQSDSPGSLRTMPIEAVVGDSTVLRRVQDFLPALDEANRKLAEAIKKQGPEDFNIEVLRSHQANSYLEMDLALGVADLYSEDAVSAAKRLTGGQAINIGSLKHDSDSEDERVPARQASTSDDESCSPSIKRMKSMKRPKIETLS